MRAVARLIVFALLVGCSAEHPHGRTERGLEIHVAPLELPGIGDACFDLRVTNGPSGLGDVVWTRGTPGLNGGTPDTGAVCSRRYGNGTGDITWVGSCDAGGQLDDDPQGERMNSVTLWFDGLYDQSGAYIAPDGPNGWRDPCPAGCTLDVSCEENADARVTFDLTIMRDGGQGFFDVAVTFDDIFCSAKLDTCYEDGASMELLFGDDDTRDWTAVFGFACTAGHGDAQTTLHYGDLAVVCTAGATTTVFPLNPVGEPGNNRVTANEHTLHYGIYRGAEALRCDDPSTGPIERCNKVYWNVAISLDDLAPLGSCVLAFAATATDGGRGFTNGLPNGVGIAYPFIEVAATLTPPSCQRHALDDGGAVRTVYRGDLASAPMVMCSVYDGAQVGPVAGTDCSDACPHDPDKTRPGICGCGVSDVDTDGDAVADCVDECPTDPNKTAAGICGCEVSDVAADRLGGSQVNAAASCVAIYEAGEACGDGRYWIDPTGGSTSDAFEVYCDMANGGWMKIESAAWPFMFSEANWTNHNAATPDVANYSIVGRRAAFIDSSGCYTFRLRAGESGHWKSAPTHETIWRQCHDPFTQTTNGSDYTYIAGQQPSTCGGFNGLHHKYQGHSKTSDPDANDTVNCWWMQVVPTLQYGTAANFPGYLDGYGGTGNTHVWQSLWIHE